MEFDRMDTENRHLAEDLSKKVSHLKSLAYDIEVETKEHNRLLDSLGWDFEGSRGVLSGSMGRVKKMLGINKSNRRLMCYVVLAIVVLFILGYALASRATRQ